MTELAIRAALSFVAGLVLVPVARQLARRMGIVARPQASRWHQRPTPLLGGLAIAVVVLAGGLTVELTTEVLLTLTGAALMAGLGLVDDIVALKSSTKLVFQIVVAAMFVYTGHRLGWANSQTADTLLTLVWIVGITNALNLLDNMDGLAAGVGAITCLSLLFTTHVSGPEAQLLAGLLGALTAFLVYNVHPASVFMGDTGSLLVGVTLAAASLGSTYQPASREVLSFIAAPVMVLAIPIFDTALVVVARLLSGRRPSEGGRDHSSHRMVAMGLSEPAAVAVLWVLAAVGGLIAVGVHWLQVEWAGLVAVTFALTLGLFAAYLADVRVYADDPDAPVQGLTPVVVEFMHKRRVLEVLLDLGLVSVAFYCAHRLRFDQQAFETAFPVFVQSLPVMIACQIPVLLALGGYRGMWRCFGLMDAVVFVQGVALGTLAGAAMLMVLHQGLPVPAAVFVIHAALLLIMLTSSRGSFRLLTEFFRRRSARLRAVLLVDDPGDVAMHRLAMQSGDYRMVGLITERPSGPGTVEGTPILGDYGTLLDLVAAGLTDVVVVSVTDVDGERIEELAEHCSVHGVALVTFRYALEPVDVPSRPHSLSPRVAGKDVSLGS